MSRVSTTNYKPRATGSLRHLTLKVFCAVLKTAPYRLNFLRYTKILCPLTLCPSCTSLMCCLRSEYRLPHTGHARLCFW